MVSMRVFTVHCDSGGNGGSAPNAIVFNDLRLTRALFVAIVRDKLLGSGKRSRSHEHDEHEGRDKNSQPSL